MCRARRAVHRMLVAGAAVTLGLATIASIAGAATATTGSSQAQINATEAQVATIEATIAQEQKQSVTLANEYDAAVAHAQAVRAALAATGTRIAHTRKVIVADKATLAKAAVEAYVLGSQGTQIAPLFVSSANTANITQEYAQTAIGNLSSARQALESEQAELTAVEARQRAEEGQAQAAVAQVQTLEQQNQAAAQAAQQTLSSVKGTLAAEVAAAEVAKARREAEQAAAARAAQQAAAAAAAARAAQQAAAVASEVGGSATADAATTAANQATSSAGGPSVTTSGAPAAGSGGAGAVAVRAAESQLGVPYVWGGETPGVGFDCSGLTQWSWGQAGVSIPRVAATQAAAVPLVWTSSSGSLSLSSLQPGDLFFYTGLDPTQPGIDHVAMYVGGDTLIQAPYTGATVSIISIYTYGLVAVGRP